MTNNGMFLCTRLSSEGKETEEEGSFLVQRRQTFMDQESKSQLTEEPEPAPPPPKFTGWTQLFILMTGAASPRCQNFPFAQKSPKRLHSRLPWTDSVSDRCWWWRLHLPFISEANTCSGRSQGLAPSARRYSGEPRPHALFQSHLLLLHPLPWGSRVSAVSSAEWTQLKLGRFIGRMNCFPSRISGRLSWNRPRICYV